MKEWDREKDRKEGRGIGREEDGEESRGRSTRGKWMMGE